MTLQHLLSGIAIAATLTVAGPLWAQNNPSGGNGMGMLGQDFGAGGNLSPDSGGGHPAPAPPATSVTPSAHHAVRHAGAMQAHHNYVARGPPVPAVRPNNSTTKSSPASRPRPKQSRQNNPTN
jgi:hypothetical protein